MIKASTLAAQLSCYNEWFNEIDYNRWVDVVFLDYSKAFDSVSHPKLLCKLRQYGFSDTLCKFMSAFLHNRRQRVRNNNAVSSSVDVYSGVPEGSCLEPLLYDLYADDLCQVVKYNN